MEPDNKSIYSAGLNEDIEALISASENLKSILDSYRIMRVRLLDLERATAHGDAAPLSEETLERLHEAQSCIDAAMQPIGMVSARATELIDEGAMLLNDVYVELRRKEDGGE